MEEKNKELELLRATLRDFEHRVEQTRQDELSRTVAVQDLQCQLEENMILIRNNKELLQEKEKQEIINAEKDQEIKEHDNIRMALQQSICVQLEALCERQTVEKESLQELQRLQESEKISNNNFTVATEDLKKKEGEVEQLRAAMEEKNKELELLRATLRDFEHRVEQTRQDELSGTALQQSICDLKDQLERRQEEILAGFENIGAEVPQASNFLDEQINDIPMQVPEEQPPAPMAQTTTFSRRCAGRVLKAGLTAGIVAAGIYTLGYLGSSNIQCMSSCVIEMIEPYCTKYDITPHPF
ncbi:hypothetical protein D5F01_LYC05192 [Larimichthys crocea]|uniref:Uncharacterized protein n=1 Tax=Larimichthys crocea TaxID=215358 RepID=A0A6G0IYL6_LARCR|nr:hypothetical protein D5F01_LYC05192 [Larimichthys crocea]